MMKTTPLLSQNEEQMMKLPQGHEEQEMMHQVDEMERWRDLLKRDSAEMVAESPYSHM